MSVPADAQAVDGVDGRDLGFSCCRLFFAQIVEAELESIMPLFWKSIGFLVIMYIHSDNLFYANEREFVPPALNTIIDECRSIDKKLVTEKKQIRFDFIVETGRNPTPSKSSGAPVAFEWNLLRNDDIWKLKTRDIHPELSSFMVDGKPVVKKGWSTSSINGSLVFTQSVFNNDVVGVTSSETISSNVFFGITYHTFLGYNLGKEIVKALKVDYAKVLDDPIASCDLKDIPFLPNCLEEHKDSYRVLPEPETIDGYLCWIVERPGMDKFWIAPGLGYMLCKRRFHWQKDKPLRMEIRAKEFKEIEPGLFFPMSVEVDKYAAYEWEDEAIWNKITGQSVYRVKDISFSNVTDKDLAIGLPVGTRVVDEARGFEYVVQEDGTDPYAGPLEMGLKRARITLFRWTMMILGGLLILFALFRMWFDGKRKSTQAVPLILLCLTPFLLGAKEPSIRIDSGAFEWKPAWREAGDCGPGALYVLMKLERKNISFDHIKQLLPIDPVHGCSMESLYNASQQMGFPVDIRFVPPSRIMEVPRPFILHGISGIKENIGHFIVVLDIDPKAGTLTLIDPSQERFSRNPCDSALQGYSGYVLVPRHPVSKSWDILAGVSLFFGGFGCLLFVCRRGWSTYSVTETCGNNPTTQ